MLKILAWKYLKCQTGNFPLMKENQGVLQNAELLKKSVVCWTFCN